MEAFYLGPFRPKGMDDTLMHVRPAFCSSQNAGRPESNLSTAQGTAMHILIINFNLHELARPEYEVVCDEVSEAFAAIPGLLSKKWLANEDTNTYGGVYLFNDRQAMLDYQASELYTSLGENPAFINITATDFEMLSAPSSVTGVPAQA